MRLAPLSLVAFLCAACLLAPTAGASPYAVVADCTDNGRIDRRHALGDFVGALRRLPSDVDEYTECRAIIEAAYRTQRQSAWYAYLRSVTFSQRGRRLHFWLHLPPCRTARRYGLRLELRALRPGRGVMVATARRQCRPVWRRHDRMLGAHLFTPRPHRVTVQLVGPQRPEARYYVRVLVGRRVMGRGVLLRFRTRTGAFGYAVPPTL